MTPIELRAAAKDLHKLHEEVKWCFGRHEAQQHALVYLRGLLLHSGRKSIEPIALRFARGRNGEPAQRKEVGALQHFITDSPWDCTFPSLSTCTPGSFFNRSSAVALGLVLNISALY